jgi:hypothetical protein
MKKDTAQKIIEMSRSYGDRLVHMSHAVRRYGTEAESKAFQKAISNVMGDALYEICRHIIREYPDLDPEEWKPGRRSIPPLPNPIAVRDLWTTDQEGQRATIKVLLAAPVPFYDTGDYVCSFQILGLGEERVNKRGGADAMDALAQALTSVDAQLQEARAQGKKIWWHDEHHPAEDIGFPVLHAGEAFRAPRVEAEPHVKKDVFKRAAALAERYVTDLEATRVTLRGECTAEELSNYEDGIDQVLEHLRDDILAPIYKEHPDLRPKGPTAPH